MQLEEWHSEDIRTVYRHFPLLTIHDKASLAGQAAEAAGAQGSFWAMHDFMYGQYSEWVGLSPEEFTQWLIIAAEELELDAKRFQNDIEGGQYALEMEEAFYQGIGSGIPGTPFSKSSNFQQTGGKRDRTSANTSRDADGKQVRRSDCSGQSRQIAEKNSA